MTCSSGSDQALRGGIAQLGERNAGSVEVRSSILLASTTKQHHPFAELFLRKYLTELLNLKYYFLISMWLCISKI